MKKSILLFVLCLVSVLFAQNHQVSLREAKSVADRNAREMWGNRLGSATPIPYYGPDDKIIAWHFNYAIDKAFPDEEALMQSCDDAMKSGNRELGQGIDEYANMVIGANRDMPVIIQCSKGLSQQYYLGEELKRAAAKEFSGSFELLKSYYLGFVDVWHCVSDGTTKKYINLYPPTKILNDTDFQKGLQEGKFFWQEDDDYDEEWTNFLDNGQTMSRNVVFIPGEDQMPFTRWSYGCVPTAASMVLCWYDNYLGYGDMVEHYFSRWDSHSGETLHHVPSILPTLAQQMDTSGDGNTDPWWIDDGFIGAIESRGYSVQQAGSNYGLQSHQEFFDMIKTIVDGGYPCLATIPAESFLGIINTNYHTVTAVGYNTSPALVYIHDSNFSGLMQITRSMLEGVFWAFINSHPEVPAKVKITAPHGGDAWLTNWGGNETLLSNDVFEITWESNIPASSSHAKLFYHVDGADENMSDWIQIMPNQTTANDGSYYWTVPDINSDTWGTTSDYVRVKIIIYDNTTLSRLASDSSYGNFKIQASSNGLPRLLGNVLHATTNPDFFSRDCNLPNTWSVIGVRDDLTDNHDNMGLPIPYSPWSIELYDDVFFTDGIAYTSFGERTSYVVIDNHHVAANDYGVKIHSNTEQSSAYVGAGGSADYNLQVGQVNHKTWTAGKVVEVYNVYLTPDRYFFKIDNNTVLKPLDYALFKWGGDGIFTYDEAVASDRRDLPQGADKSFTYNATQAGWYGLVVSSKETNAGVYDISIQSSSKWLGYSSSWQDPANWSMGIVPTNQWDVIIPSGCSSYPLISGSYANAAVVRSMTIEAGAGVFVTDNTLSITESLYLFGNLQLSSASSRVYVNSVFMESGSLMAASSSSQIYCSGSWDAMQGSATTFSHQSQVIFHSDQQAYLQISSPMVAFNYLTISKTGGAEVFFTNSESNLIVNGTFRINEGATFTFFSDNRKMELRSLYQNYGSIHFDAGTLKFAGDFAYLMTNPGDYYHNIEVSTNLLTQLPNDVYINGDLTITRGGLIAGTKKIYLGGDWKNNNRPNGFNKGTGTVIFNGDGIQQCFGEDFNKLEIASPTSIVKFVAGTSTCDSYNWTAGTLSINGGTLTIADLFDNGLFGSYEVHSGALHVNQNSTNYIDLNGELTIHGGIMTVTGGSGTSWWALSYDASIVMTGGVLDFTNRGIQISNQRLLNSYIGGGTIRTVGDFRCDRADFLPEGGTIEMYGTGDNTLYLNSNAQVPNLRINKAVSRDDDLRISRVSLLTDINIYCSLLLTSGTFSLDGHTVNVVDEMEVTGNLNMTNSADIINIENSLYWNEGATGTITAGEIQIGGWLEIAAGSNFTAGTGNTLRFDGSSEVIIVNHASGSILSNVIIAKEEDYPNVRFEGPIPLTIAGNLTVNNLNNFTVSNYDLTVNGNVTTGLDTDFEVTAGGRLLVGWNFSALGHVLVEDASLICNNDFILSTGADMEIGEYGNVVLQKPYNGQTVSFSGTVVISNDGILEISNNGLRIGTSRNIIMYDGTIKLGGGFRASNPSTFWGDYGTVEFIGARAATIEMGTGNYFHNLVINKPNVIYPAQFESHVVVKGDFTVLGGNPKLNSHTLNVGRDLIINGGRLTASNATDIIQVGRNWSNNVGTVAFEEGVGTVIFNEAATPYSGTISTETFHQLNINKANQPNLNIMQTAPGSIVTAKSILNINSGELIIGQNATLRADSNINVCSKLSLGAGSILNMNHNYIFSVTTGGRFNAIGTAVYPAKVTSDTGYYAFNVDSGGTIAAQHCIFEKMNVNGINVASGATIDPTYFFHHCTFQNGASGGTLLKKNNNQASWVNSAIFPTNTWGSTYNVYQNPSAGSIDFHNASGGFYGAAYENDPGGRIFWTNVSSSPTVAHSPVPANGATEVLTSTSLSWEYTSTPNFADPIGFIVKMGTDPTMNVGQTTYKVGGPGTHLMQPPMALVAGNTYYWQIIPTTEVQGRITEPEFSSNNSDRGAAIDCPVWSFTTAGAVQAITYYPYSVDFENGGRNWTSGAISGTNHWQWGSPTVAPMNTAHSGGNVWATYLSQNYDNNADTWLMSPPLNFGSVSAPNFSVWLHLNCELNWDAMILESSINNGSTWQKVIGDAGFYNNYTSSGPIPANKWSGQIGVWNQYSTALTGLGYQNSVYLRFRFGSDNSITHQGMAVDDIMIWDANAGPTFAWAEDFTGVATGTLPTGWESTHINWSVQNTTFAGGTAPEMRFNYSPASTDNFYLKSPLLDTTGFTQLALSYKQFTDHYNTPYTLKLMSIVGTTEYLIQEWVNPTGDIGASTFTHILTAANHGVGASNLRLAWVLSGNSFNIDYWYLDDINLISQSPFPTIAHTPFPTNGASIVPVTTQLGWTYTSNSENPDPTGYKLRLGTSSTMETYQESYTTGGPGTYLITPNIGLAPSTTYYWQVIPSTDVRGERSSSLATASESSSWEQRNDAVNSPIWSFTTVAAQPITSFPYIEGFESGAAGWSNGAVSGNNHWQVGTPAQTVINTAHSGSNAWMTYLAANYENNANTWLKSPPMNFSSMSNPKISLWLNIWCESNWDGMILESSIDGGASWQYVSGDPGFYSPGEPYGPIVVPKWYGMNGAWVQYSSSLSGLENQASVYLRFRFASDESGVFEGIALDDVRIWNEEIPPAVAHTPIPAHNATNVSINTQLGWTYTSNPAYTDPLSYIVRGGTDPLLATYDVTHVNGGPGTYSIPMFFDISYSGTYYWQVIPTTDTFSRNTSAEFGSAKEMSHSFRADAVNCPIWSFTVESVPIPISAFPYFQNYESGAAGWNSGFVWGSDLWQLGTPAQTHINTAHSGTNAWMTSLNQNYPNNTNTWLKSPSFDFSALSNPMVSVWINHWCEFNYDGMILESSIDGGASWQYVSGSPGFYNTSEPYGMIAAPKWSGLSGIWTEYSTNLTGLAHYPLVNLRFRFASDEARAFEGIALDDVSIWDNQDPLFSVNPSSWDFGSIEQGQVSNNHEFQISNLGLGTISIAPADIQIIGINAGEFTLTNIPQAVNLETGQSAIVSVGFAPTSVGDMTAFLQIDDNLGVVRSLGITRLNQNTRDTVDRNLNQVPLFGISLAPAVYDLPFSEDFSRAGMNSIPMDWEVSHDNWSIQLSEEASGTIPELVFSSSPIATGSFYITSPRINTADMNQLSFSFKHRVVHAAGNYTLKVVSIVGTTQRLIQQWINPSASIPAQDLQFTLDSVNHGIGAADLRIAWIFTGNSANINAWHIDDIYLEATAPKVVTGNATNITTQSATLNATITSTGSTNITAKGFYYGTNTNPIMTGAMIISDSPGNDFTLLLSGIASGVEIYYCGFATNSQGTGYGYEYSFTTELETLEAPQNLHIAEASGMIVLSWDPVSNATSYKVLSSNTPNGTFNEDLGGVFGVCTWTAPITGSKKFYLVKAVGGSSSSFVAVPAGTFTMGRSTGAGDPDEVPSHEVTLNAFYIGRTEVTQRQWQDIMGSNPASGFGVGDLYPVYNVSWYSVLKYCNLRSISEGLLPAYTINGSTNPNDWGAIPTDFNSAWDNVICNWNANGYRLPTEAEWEYAARGATNTPDFLYSGSNDSNSVAWHYENSPDGMKQVAQKAHNSLGIYDMSGNANELCWDWSSAYSSDPSENPTGNATGVERIRRGGFWNAYEFYSRVVQRDSSYPFVANEYLGFRLCRSAQSRLSLGAKD